MWQGFGVRLSFEPIKVEGMGGGYCFNFHRWRKMSPVLC